jgi:hypothetical protein
MAERSAGDVSSSWLPTWFGVLFTLVFIGILAVHLGHLGAMTGRPRLWHGSHALMALGMIDMFWPGDRGVVAASVGEITFGIVAGALLALAVVGAARGARSWLWLVAALDSVGMASMFAMSSTYDLLVSTLVATWFAMEAFGWASGRLDAVAQREGLMAAQCCAQADECSQQQDARLNTRGGAVATSPLATSLLATAVAAQHRAVQEKSVRISLALMSVGMAYMVLAMRFGMPVGVSVVPGSGHVPTVPGMRGM